MADFETPAPAFSAEPDTQPPKQGWITTFSSLKNRQYRLFWLGMLASFIAIHLQLVARNWLVYELTDSALSLGIVVGAWGLPILLLSLYGGAIADRLNKRALLIWTQVANGAITLVIAILITIDRIDFWHLVAAAALTGIIFAIHVPARLAIVPELVPRREFLNAIALNATGMNLSRFLGFAIGGLLLAAIDVDGVYYLVVFSYFLSVALLFMLPVVKKVRKLASTTLRADLMEGLRYIHHNTLIRSLLALFFVSIGFGLPYMNLMPVFARDIFRVGETGLGFLLGSAGLGALLGSLIIASLGDFRRKGALVISLSAVFGGSIILFALSAADPFYLFSYPFALALMLMVGLLGTGYLALNTTLVQSNVPPRLLGRVMSVYVVSFSFMPLGTVPLGAITDAVGAPLAIGAGGAIVALFALGLVALLPRLWRLE